MKNNKSPGIDEIRSKMIQVGRDCLTDHLHYLSNLIWKETRRETAVAMTAVLG